MTQNKTTSLSKRVILIMGFMIAFLLVFIITLSFVHKEISQENYNYGCAYGCYYGLGKDELPLDFSFDNNQMVCILKCIKDYGELK